MSTKTVEEVQAQVERLDARLGVGVGAVRERARLAELLSVPAGEQVQR